MQFLITIKKAVKRARSGMSLLEVLMSLAVFAVLVTAAASSILGSIDANQKAQSINSVMTNLTVALESMSRDIRVGSNYSLNGAATPSANGSATEFYYTDDRGVKKRLFLDIDADTDRGSIQIKEVDSVDDAMLITASEVDIKELKFSLLVNDSSTGSDWEERRQPSVKITIVGEVRVQDRTATEFYLQTLVSQRMLNTEL